MKKTRNTWMLATVDGADVPGSGRVYKDGETAAFIGKEVRIKAGNGAVAQVIYNGQLIAGLGKDRAGVAFLAREIGVNGIITSHSALVAAARAERVIAVQRLLLYDDLGLHSAMTAVEHARPDIVEVQPAVIFPLVADQIRARHPVPIIVGGFVTEPHQRQAALERGARAISTSTASLWP